MNKTEKPVIALLLAMILLFQGVVVCYSDYHDDPMPTSDIRYSNIYRTSCSCNISGVTVNCKAEMTCNSSFYMTIAMELQKMKNGSYSTVQTWNSSNTGTFLSITKTRLINVLSTYRLKVTFTAGGEAVTAYAYP